MRRYRVLRYQAAYYQQRSVDESKRYLQELSQKLVMKFKMFSVLQLNVSNDIDSAWR